MRVGAAEDFSLQQRLVKESFRYKSQANVVSPGEGLFPGEASGCDTVVMGKEVEN